MSKVTIALVVALGAATTLPLGATAAHTSASPSCSAVTAKPAHPDAARGRDFYNVAFRVRCNFRITHLRLSTSRGLIRVLQHPVLEHADNGDRLTCERAAPRRARCRGDVGQGARIVGDLKVRGGPCRPPRLHVRFSGFGGEDCDLPGQACSDIGYGAKKRIHNTRGCG
jgi:hypothetical protein